MHALSLTVQGAARGLTTRRAHGAGQETARARRGRDEEGSHGFFGCLKSRVLIVVVRRRDSSSFSLTPYRGRYRRKSPSRFFDRGGTSCASEKGGVVARESLEERKGEFFEQAKRAIDDFVSVKAAAAKRFSALPRRHAAYCFFPPHPATEMVTAVGGLDEEDMVAGNKNQKEKKLSSLSSLLSLWTRRVRRESSDRRSPLFFCSSLFSFQPLAQKERRVHERSPLLTPRAAHSIQSIRIQRETKQKKK